MPRAAGRGPRGAGRVSATVVLLAGSVVHAPMTFAADGCGESGGDECMVVVGKRHGPAGLSFIFNMEGMIADLLRWQADMTNLLPPEPSVDDDCDVEDLEDCIVVTGKRVTNSAGILLPQYQRIDCYEDLVGVATRITSEYEEDRSPKKKHNGIDLHAPTGTSVYAAKVGVVDEVVWDVEEGIKDPPPNGNFVRINYDDGTQGVYLHLEFDSVVVKEGDRVFAGDHIANANNTGQSDGPHLHYTQYTDTKNRKHVDPTKEHGNC